MRRFWCVCGHPLYFESVRCTRCHAEGGYDPGQCDMVPLSSSGQVANLFGAGNSFRYCRNGSEFSACNWLVDDDTADEYCRACAFNRTIPDLSKPDNLVRWRRFEQAKKRLLYGLNYLGLPLVNGWYDSGRGLLFDFIEDQRSNPVLLESFVSTGYLSGVITINAMEADTVAREATREQFNESYRTLLGHLRHESGHYYYWIAGEQAEFASRFVELFGDPAQDYSNSLSSHYDSGAPENWQDEYISSYATAHPLEDWAECWSHYLHISDTLETAISYRVVTGEQAGQFPRLLAQWKDFSVTLNELNRSMGLHDAYPFVIGSRVEAKLQFIDQVVRELSYPEPAVAVR